MGQAQAHIAEALLLAVFIMVLGLRVVSAPPVPPDVFDPNPPIAGEPFTITIENGTPGSSWRVGITCGSTEFASGIYTTVPYTTPPITIPSAGTYYYAADGDLNACGATTLGFVVDPAPTAAYIPVTVGGTMLPINRLQVILPWLALITMLGTVSVWTLLAKRRR